MREVLQAASLVGCCDVGRTQQRRGYRYKATPAASRLRGCAKVTTHDPGVLSVPGPELKHSFAGNESLVIPL